MDEKNVEAAPDRDVKTLKRDEHDLDQKCEECREPLLAAHVTLVFPMPSRKQAEAIHALNSLVTRFRYLGVYVDRLHSDKARELVESKQVQKWCATRGLLQTTTGGDNPASNGHVESEVNQLKRRTRLLLRQAGLSATSWPIALRYAAEDRLRHQLEGLGSHRFP